MQGGLQCIADEGGNGILDVRGGTVNATATKDNGVGLQFNLNGALFSGGTTVAKGKQSALEAPVSPTITNMTAVGNVNYDGGTGDEPFDTAKMFDYKYFRVEPAPATITSVAVSPTTLTVAKGASGSFSALVTGTGSPAQTVTWDVEDETSANTVISASGVLTVGGDETVSPLTVRATSTVDTSKNGTATVTVIPSTGTVDSVTISPPVASVGKGGTQRFTATVTGPYAPSQAVTWSVSNNSSTSTTISTDGLLTVGSDETEGGTVRVTATSAADPSKSDTVDVAVHAAATTVTISPTGGTRFPVGNAQSVAVFTVTSSNGTLNATNNYGSATLDNLPLDLGSVGAPGADGSVANGSLIVTINQAKLNTLAAGEHTLTITLRSMPVEQVRGVITVIGTGGGEAGDVEIEVPRTGDDSMPMLWRGILLLSGAVLAVSILLRRKKRESGSK